jgi:recombination protein RecT
MANGSNNNGNAGQIVPFKEKVNMMRGLLDRMKDQLAMALPQHVKVEKFLRVALTAVQKEPKLLDCYQPSFLGALVECAQLGLEPNTTLGHAWLIPFRNNRAGRVECQLIPGYKGLIKLAYQSGQVASIRAHVVRAKDRFDYEEGLYPKLHHKPFPDGDAGGLVAVYAVATIRGVDEPLFKVMQRWECEKVRDDYSKQRDKGPWHEQFDEMCMKTVVRRLMKWIPSDTEKSTLLARAVDLDERAQAGIGQEFGDVIDISPEAVADVGQEASGQPAGDGQRPAAEPAGQPSKLDQLAADAEQRRAAVKS